MSELTNSCMNPFHLGYAGAALLAIVFALPFSSRILFHNEVGPWKSFAQAFFHTHLELFLGNACLGKSSCPRHVCPARPGLATLKTSSTGCSVTWRAFSKNLSKRQLNTKMMSDEDRKDILEKVAKETLQLRFAKILRC